MNDITVQQIMDRLPQAFIPEQAQGVDATVQFNLSGNEGGDYIVRIQDGTCRVDNGTADYPNLTLSADAQEFKEVITGQTNPMTSFMQGKLRVSGDLTLGMKLLNFFKMS